jgi:serine protease Do
MRTRHLSTLALLLALAGPAAAEKKYWTDGVIDTGVTEDTPVTYGAFSKLTKRAAPAVVAIETETAQSMGGLLGHPFLPPMVSRGAGSGFIIRSDGYILSNNHVVENARTVKVHLLDGRKFTAEVIGSDPATDVSVLKIDAGGKPLPTVPLGDSDTVQIAEWVIAIGNPLGLSHTVTAGIVSAKGRREVQPDGRLRYRDFIQTDASINPGNSGGPLFNLRGQVVGVNTAVSAEGQGIGFAIPINMVKTVLPSLIERGRVERSWLGVQIQAVDEDLAKALRLERTHGALVAAIVRDGPADRAGLQKGDVIVAFDGQNIESHDDLPWLASIAGIGRIVDVGVLREGQPRTVKVKLESMPDPSAPRPRLQGRRAEGTSSTVGLTLETLGEDNAKRAGLDGGATITRVDPGSPAAAVGLRRGDIVVEVDGAPVARAGDVARRLDAVKKGDEIRLLVLRGETRSHVAFRR